MARTKQTARRTCAGKAPRRIVNSGIEIEESSQKAANTDQFSLKFDDQEKCEKEAVSHEMRRCDKCEAFLTAQSLIIKK